MTTSPSFIPCPRATRHTIVDKIIAQQNLDFIQLPVNDWALIKLVVGSLIANLIGDIYTIGLAKISL